MGGGFKAQTVILRCEPLRASKDDGWALAAILRDAREERAPQDDLAMVAILFLKTEPSSFARITFSQLGE